MKRYLLSLPLVLALAACGQSALANQPPSESAEAQAIKPAASPHTVLIRATADQTGLLAQPVDPAALSPLPGFQPMDLGGHNDQALAPDGSLWGVIVWPGAGFYGGVLHLVDLTTWQTEPTDLTFSSYISLMTFSPDGSRLAVSQIDWSSNDSTAHVYLIDTRQPDAETTRVVPLPFVPRNGRFSRDRQEFYAYGTSRESTSYEAVPPTVAALEVESGKLDWSLTLDEVAHGDFASEDGEDAWTDPYGPDSRHYQPGVVFSEDAQWLYVVHADEDRFTRVNLATGRATSRAIRPAQALLDRLVSLTARPVHAKGPLNGVVKSAALSPDGSLLYVAGLETAWTETQQTGTYGNTETTTSIEQQSLGLLVVDAQTGQQISRLSTEMDGVSLSPDGKALYLTHHRDTWADADAPADLPALEVLDADTLQPVATLERGAAWADLTFAPTGSQAYLITVTFKPRGYDEATVHVLDSATGRVAASREFTGWASLLGLRGG